MDSLTQITLGAAIGGALMGRRKGRKALALGALIGTFPDLDVFIPYGDDVSNFTYHRGFTHSFLFCFVMTYPLAWLFSKIRAFGFEKPCIRLNITIFLILLTHILLDAMTIYGTQLFWPLTIPPVGIGSVFIIDPLYTLPLLISLMIFLIKPQMVKALYTGLVISTAYLLWSMSAQGYIEKLALAQLPPQEQDHLLLVQPTALNTLLWRVLVMDDAGYKVAYISVFDDDKTLEFTSYRSPNDIISPIENSFAVKRLKWFTKGFYSVEEREGGVYMQDLRMGTEPDNYVFRFKVGARNENGQVIEVLNKIARPDRSTDRLSGIWDRIWDENMSLQAAR